MSGTLIVCAHHDDETLGAGGLIASLVPNPDIAVGILGEGPFSPGRVYEMQPGQKRVFSHIRQECERAMDALGDMHIGYNLHMNHFLPDNQFDTVPLVKIVNEVEMLLEKYRPTSVYTHQPHDLNIDHRLTCQAVLTATRPVPGQTVKAVYGFEVPSSTEWAFGAPPFTPNVFQPLTDDQMERKRQALRCYASELRDFPHPRSIEAVDALARYRGSQCGHPWAEAFQLLREIR